MKKNNINTTINILPSVHETDKFMNLLEETLSSLNPSLNYSLEYCLYLYTNDKDRGFKDVDISVGSIYDKNPEDLLKYILASQIFEAIYEFKGYGVVHYDLFNNKDLVYTPQKLKDYVSNIFTMLEANITKTNQSESDKDEFIEFKRPLVLIITSFYTPLHQIQDGRREDKD